MQQRVAILGINAAEWGIAEVARYLACKQRILKKGSHLPPSSMFLTGNKRLNTVFNGT
jgi:hypothetical protein